MKCDTYPSHNISQSSCSFFFCFRFFFLCSPSQYSCKPFFFLQFHSLHLFSSFVCEWILFAFSFLTSKYRYRAQCKPIKSWLFFRCCCCYFVAVLDVQNCINQMVNRVFLFVFIFFLCDRCVLFLISVARPKYWFFWENKRFMFHITIFWIFGMDKMDTHQLSR